MSGQETGGQERARAFNAVGRALPADRFVSLSERQAVADAVLEVLGYGTHRCVRCGQQQAPLHRLCPPCDLLNVGDVVNAQAAETQRLRAEVDVKDAQIAEQQAEIERLKTPFEVTIGWPDMSDEELAALERELKAALKRPQQITVLPSDNWKRRAERYRLAWTSARQRARSMTQNAQDWCETAKLTEAERDRLRAAEKRVREIHDEIPCECSKCRGRREGEWGAPDWVCQECSIDNGASGAVVWPCPTIAALDQSDTSTPQQAADDTHAAGTKWVAG